MVESEPSISCEGNLLSVNGHQTRLEGDIKKYIIIDERIVVLLDHESFSEEDRAQESNVFGVSFDGQVLWQIEAHPGEVDEGEIIMNPYVNVVLREKENKLVAYDMDGSCFDLDPRSGKTSKPVFTR